MRKRKISARLKTMDSIKLHLNGLNIEMRRKTNPNIPHEVTIVVPRASIKETIVKGRLRKREIIMNSITIAHSPRL